MEGEWLKAVALGDQAAFARLYHAYAERIYAVGMTYLQDERQATEQVQDIFIKVWNQREKLETVADFKSWLFIISRNAIYDRFREQKAEARRRVVLARAEEGEGVVADTADRLENHQYEALLQKAVNQLPAQRRKIYIYSRREGMTVDEIAAAMGLSRFTVKNQLKAANHYIRDHFKDHLELLLIGAVFLHH